MNKKHIQNLTPHDVHLVLGDKTYTFPKADSPLRLGEVVIDDDDLEGFPVVKKHFTATTLQNEERGTYYIVSSLVALAFPDRNDLLVPDDIIRDEHGRIVGCRRFARIKGDFHER